jgi:hypothetical protein
MKRLLSCLVFAWSLPLLAEDRVHLTAIGTPDGAYDTYYASEQQVSSSPVWDPAKDSLPLSVPKAVSLAKVWLKQQHPKFDDLILRSIQIEPVSAARAKSRWFYMLNFDPVVDGRAFWGGDLHAAILMDGTIVVPVQTHESH